MQAANLMVFVPLCYRGNAKLTSGGICPEQWVFLSAVTGPVARDLMVEREVNPLSEIKQRNGKGKGRFLYSQ